MNAPKTKRAGKAKYMRQLKNFTGDAALYRVTPMMVGNKGKKTKYVVVSATVVVFSGPETYIFACDKNGEISDWLEMEGSYRGGLNHARALRAAGYEPVGAA